MTSLIQRSAILTLSRITNYAILLISPLFLVRLLDVHQFGQYREFILYSSVLSSLLSFYVNRSLTYFLPKYPGDEKTYITQALVSRLIITSLGLAAVALAKPLLIELISFDFVFLLIVYSFLFLNFDFLEYYWLAKKRTDYVLYYASMRLVSRTVAVVVVAYLTVSVTAIIYALIVVELIRVLFVIIFVIRQRLISKTIEQEKFRQHAAFFLSLGFAGLIGQAINKHLTLLFVSVNAGAAGLAFYAIGNYMTPFVDIIRGSISDVIFPEMAGKRSKDPRVVLRLWQRSTVLYCFALFPIALVLFAYTDTILTVLFTDAYLPAASVFQIFLLQLITECFDVGLPLRILNRTRVFIFGNALALVANIFLMFIFYSWFGLPGPALAYIFGSLVSRVYLTRQLLKHTGWALAEMLDWGSVFRIAGACAICSPVVFFGELVPIPESAQAAVFSAVFAIAYFVVIRTFGVGEVAYLSRRLTHTPFFKKVF